MENNELNKKVIEKMCIRDRNIIEMAFGREELIVV